MQSNLPLGQVPWADHLQLFGVLKQHRRRIWFPPDRALAPDHDQSFRSSIRSKIKIARWPFMVCAFHIWKVHIESRMTRRREVGALRIRINPRLHGNAELIGAKGKGGKGIIRSARNSPHDKIKLGWQRRRSDRAYYSCGEGLRVRGSINNRVTPALADEIARLAFQGQLRELRRRAMDSKKDETRGYKEFSHSNVMSVKSLAKPQQHLLGKVG